MWNWEQQLHGSPSSALSFSGEGNGPGVATPSPIHWVLVLSPRAVELCTLKEILLATAFVPIYLESPKGRRVRKEEISGRH